MARLRKAARILRTDEARIMAARVLVPEDCPYFTIDPPKLFERDAPLEIELGAGRGDFIIERAAGFPERNFLAVELAGSVAKLMAVRAGRRELTNLRAVRMDARTLVNLMLPARSVDACHIYFPDPWPKERHVKHRLFTPLFATNLKRSLKANGMLFVATDVRDYAHAAFAMLEAAGLERVEAAVPGACRTGFGRKFADAGLPIYAAAFVKSG